MKHRMYERILYDTYTKLNKGLEYIHDVQGHGCPLGMEPITLEELEYDRKSSAYDVKLEILERPKEEPLYARFLYDNREAYIKYLTSIGQWPMECNKKTITEDRYKYLRNNIFNKH